MWPPPRTNQISLSNGADFSPNNQAFYQRCAAIVKHYYYYEVISVLSLRANTPKYTMALTRFNRLATFEWT